MLLFAVASLVLSPTLQQHCQRDHAAVVTAAAAAAATLSRHHQLLLRLRMTEEAVEPAVESAVVSPFDEEKSEAPAAKTGPLELTEENVELVLDDMRPYLMADGGNVALRSIEGGIVQLELQGACGTCPSSTMTMKMGLERGLLERIPEIVTVEQVTPEGPVLEADGIEAVLEEIRPFLKMTGGTVDLVELEAEGLQPTAKLAITGSGATINSVRVEIAQRLKRNVRRPLSLSVAFALALAPLTTAACAFASCVQFPTLANVEWE